MDTVWYMGTGLVCSVVLGWMAFNRVPFHWSKIPQAIWLMCMPGIGSASGAISILVPGALPISLDTKLVFIAATLSSINSLVLIDRADTSKTLLAICRISWIVVFACVIAFLYIQIFR